MEIWKKRKEKKLFECNLSTQGSNKKLNISFSFSFFFFIKTQSLKISLAIQRNGGVLINRTMSVLFANPNLGEAG